MSKKDTALKDILEFFIESDIDGTITVDIYNWNESVARSALNNLKNKNLLSCRRSEIFNKCLEYSATDSLKEMESVLKPMGRAQRLKYIKEMYKPQTAMS